MVGGAGGRRRGGCGETPLESPGRHGRNNEPCGSSSRVQDCATGDPQFSATTLRFPLP
ncbi:hypothetical protein HMPREF1549_00684 [Actinomyces johnsonii F0510]|uniref:Uncharacterized protein n=1 Tax=Actinomyces johnsonii F0510 TaxID=1227262 RepID=U1QHR1_9ACTO|nr:hypothetical protein HMPREF1549_00684 [Actinomyces johnsonii F0510]